MSGSPRSGQSALEDPFSVLPPRFGERPAGLTSVALHSFSVLKNNGLAHITGDARPFPLTMLTGYTANERDMSQGV